MVGVSAVSMVAHFVMPGLNQRFMWSDVPAVTAVPTDLLIPLDCGLLVWSMWEDRYASRTVEAGEGQCVTRTGPCGVVRPQCARP
jgi:protein-S-isoprenylcysteine O-methyltransferase Ste14